MVDFAATGASRNLGKRRVIESLTEEEETDEVVWMVEGLVRRSQEIPSWGREMRRGERMVGRTGAAVAGEPAAAAWVAP
jgi:hypothetical protein